MSKKENKMPELPKITCFASFFAGFLLAIAVPVQAAVVKYNKLTESLPYGAPITIAGDLSGFKRGRTEVRELIDIQSITLRYQVNDLAVKSSVASIIGEKWQFLLEKLPENSPVLFTSQLTGKIAEKKASKVNEELTFEALSFMRTHQEFPVRSRSTRVLPDGFNLVDDETQEYARIDNMSAVNLTNLNKRSVGDRRLEFNVEMPLRENHDKLIPKTQPADDKPADDMPTDSTSIEKYAGFDIGAMHLPAIDELRGFYTVNIYFGAVGETPEPFFSKDVLKRLSLVAGGSFKDISGASQSKIKGHNAFLIGLGLRMNKLFRINAGFSFYRSSDPSAESSLKRAFYRGISIDISQFPILKSIVEKNIK